MPTTDEIKRSRRKSAPIEWAKFELGTLATFRYASGRTDVTHNGDVYGAVAMKRTSPKLSQEINQSGITITLPRDCELWRFFKYVAPTLSCDVTVYGQQVGDNTVYQVFQGFVSGFAEKVDSDGKSLVDVKIDSEVSALRRLGLRQLYSPKCRFFLYDGRCPVPKAPFTVETTITAVADLQIKSGAFDAKPDGWFALGWAETEKGERAMIVSHVGDTLTLIRPFRESQLGKIVKAFAGCDHTPDICRDKFGDYTNDGRDFGGFPLVPIKPPNQGIN